MKSTAGSQRARQRNDERLFAAVAIVISLAVGAGFCSLLFALNHHENVHEHATQIASGNVESRLIPPDHPRQLADFCLIDRTKRAVTRSDLEGKILVVDFLFASCSLTCPAVNNEMAKIQQLTMNLPDVKLVSLTVDPRDDTPGALNKYSGRFGANTNRWLFLTGEKSVIYNLIETSFLTQGLNDPFSYMPGNFSHTERIAIVGAHGRLRGYFNGLNQNTAAAAVKEIKKLQNQNL